MAQGSDAGAASAFADARALLIDLDGTLVDSSAPILRAWTTFAQRHGLDPEAAIHFAERQAKRPAQAPEPASIP